MMNLIKNTKDKEVYRLINKILPVSASFLVTEDCNLACVYCFENHKKNTMSKEVVHRGLEYLCNNAKILKNDEGFHVMIFGGEPLMYPEIVEEICEYGYQLQQKHKVKFTANLITNATIMSEEIFYILTNYKNKIGLTCQLSIDGNEYSQNLYRVTKQGKGSFDLLKKNIDKFKRIYSDKPKMLSVHGCINKETISHMYENYLFFREEWNLEKIWFMPIHEIEWDENDVITYEEQLNKICDYMLTKSKENKNLDEIEMYTPINNCLMPYNKVLSPCGAGKNFITVTSKGDIYPCHLFYFNDHEEQFKMGNVIDGVDEEDRVRKQFMGYVHDEKACYNECECANCYRCLGVNWLHNGDPLKQIQGYYCSLSRVDKKITDRMKEEIKKLDFIDLDNKFDMRKEREWVENNELHEIYINSVGEEKEFVSPLTEEQQNQVDNYYSLNAFNIIAKSQTAILNKLITMEERLKQIGVM